MTACPNPMGFYQTVFGSDGTTFPDLNLNKKFQWFFSINNITDSVTSASQPLPCIKASRPKLNFREMQAEHLNETITYPSKPEWQSIQISLYQRIIGTFENPIFTWLKLQYDPSPTGCSAWYPCIDPLSFKPCATLYLYSSCGDIVEEWIFEHVYPQNIDWDELDMAESAVVMVNFTLKYDRAWQSMACGAPPTPHTIYETGDTSCNTCMDLCCDEQCPGTGVDSGTGGDSDGSSQNPDDSQNPDAQGGGANATIPQDTASSNPQNTISLGGVGDGIASLSGSNLAISFTGSGATDSMGSNITGAIGGYLSQAQAAFGVFASPNPTSTSNVNGVTTVTFTVARTPLILGSVVSTPALNSINFSQPQLKEPDFVMF